MPTTIATSNGIPFLRHFSQCVEKVLRRTRHEAAKRGSFNQAAIVADISFAGFRVFGDPMPGSDVGAIVETRCRDRYREFVEASLRDQFIAFVDLLLAWSFGDNDGLDGWSRA